ncbi:nucleotide exchange factor SIL1-like [Daphnia carinata]|uniref:nucleotide exchange factor SIL1-like n=1 Tax=Daphnia carinata TaxID=120202 RepID=UPI00257C3854|nr:nucleotide exchange factor SIL1-like [Daphnia carinata]
MYKVFVVSICVFHLSSVLYAIEGPVSLDPKMNKPDEKKFIPTKEWQVVAEGQGIPPGLHVRIDMQTGVKEAKLLEEGNNGGSPNSALMNTVPSVEDKKEEVKPELDYSEIKEALKKIKSDAKETSEGNIGKGFRTYEEIKEEMKKIEQSIKTEYEIVKELVAKYLSTKEDLERQVILSDLEFYVHQYDNAQDFVKMGGFSDVVLPALNSTNKDLRSSAAFLLGSACQSNPKAQIAAVERGVLPQLIRLVSFDPNPDVRNRALYAISSIIRHFPLAQKDFINHGGMTAFADIFLAGSADSLKLQLKIVTLLGDIILEKDMAAQRLEDFTKGGLSESTNEAEKVMLAEKLRQYEAAGVEKMLVEQNFCRLLPRLLTSIGTVDDKQARMEDLSFIQGRPLREEHDVIEKVLQAMLILARSCRTDFQSVRNQIQTLGERYQELKNVEQAEMSSRTLDGEKDSIDLYYSKIHDMCQQLWMQLQKDEL